MWFLIRKNFFGSLQFLYYKERNIIGKRFYSHSNLDSQYHLCGANVYSRKNINHLSIILTMLATAREACENEWSQLRQYFRSLHIGNLLFAQTVSSFAESALLHAFDLMTTRLQVSGDYSAASVRAEAARVYSAGGVRSFYRGYAFTSISSIPIELVYRLTYDFQCRSSQRSPFIAGILASSLTSLLYVPAEVISQRLQMSARGVTAWQVGTSLYATSGLRGFYPTIAVSVVVNPIRDGLWWCIYEKCRRHSDNSILLSSSLASVMTAAIFNPVEVVKTKLQTGQSQLSAAGLAWQMASTPRGRLALLGAGLLPSMARAAFDGYIHAFSYETIFHFAKK